MNSLILCNDIGHRVWESLLKDVINIDRNSNTKGTKVQTLGGRAVAGAWLVAWAIMAMGAIINTHAHR